ncbi:ABC transporter permease, partial [Mesorhizobium sp. M00.F.Ca.ET.158.01.1.1]
YLSPGQSAIPYNASLYSFIALSDGRLFNIIPYSAVIAIVLLAAFGYMMQHRPFGRQIYAVGGNQEVARLAGYDVRRVKFICFIISSLLATVAGIIL